MTLKLCFKQSHGTLALQLQHNLDEHFEALLAALQQDLEDVLLLDEITLHGLYRLEIRESKHW